LLAFKNEVNDTTFDLAAYDRQLHNLDVPQQQLVNKLLVNLNEILPQLSSIEPASPLTSEYPHAAAQATNTQLL
jgi:hypothetical protein